MNKLINTSDSDIKGDNSPNTASEDSLEALAGYLNAVMPTITSVEEPCLIDGVPSVGYVYIWESRATDFDDSADNKDATK